MTSTAPYRTRFGLCLAAISLILPSCGNSPLGDLKEGSQETLFSTVEDPNWGKFELLAAGQNPDTGKYSFLVRASRSVTKNQLRFIWDFGTGPVGEGMQQSYLFSRNGDHVVTVTAYGADDSVAFVLKLSINIGATSNLPPTAVATTDEVAGENQRVLLMGGGSSDPENDELSYEWVQVSGPPVQILNAQEASASFIAPIVGGSEDLGFRLYVSDGEFTAFADVVVLVEQLIDPSGSDGDVRDFPGSVSPLVDLNEDGLFNAEDQRINCIVSNSNGRSLNFFPQNGTFEVGFTAIPNQAFMDAIVGLSEISTNRLSELAVLIRFSPAGTIDVRNGGAYDADNDLWYDVDQRFQFRVIVNVPARTYSVFVTPDGETEIKLATDYAFRTEQNTVTTLGFWNLWSDVGTNLTLCNLRLSPSLVTANAGADVTVSPGGSTILQGSANGGQGPYTYSWSPETGLTNALIATPTAKVYATTTYTLTVKDVWGATSTDSVTVTLRSLELAAKAGADKDMVADGSTQLDGSATGGTAPYTYKWSPITGLSDNTIATPTARPSTTTTYTLTVTDSAGETASDAMVVTVTDAPIRDALIVDGGAPNASDSNSGTEDAPWKTLKKAASTARAGQTVLVKAGVYYETLSPGTSGVAGELINFKAYPGDECKGDFAGTKSDCRVIIDGQNSRSNGINAYPRKFVRFEGFEIRNHTDDGVFLQGYYDTTADGLEVVNCKVHHNGNDAISFRGKSKNCLVENCELHDNSQTGISFGGGSGHKLLGNNIHYNGKDGIRGAGDNHLIESNIMYDQFHTDLHPDGMDLGDMSNSILRYNTLSDFTQLMYFHDYDNGGGFSNLQIYGNVFYTNRYWTINGGEAPAVFFDASFNNSPIKNVTIHSNTFLWTGYNGIIMYGGPLDGVTICNNIFYDSGIDLDGRTTGVKTDYNVFYNSRKPANEGANSITANPQFVAYTRHQSWNVRLKSTSPAINKGDPNLLTLTGLSSGFVDKDGNLRPNGLRCDMGAYEYQP